ncbi:hypothetical protein AB3G45_04470 [Shinella sp. S4-D37]|uniref:hypothetical protein n=1 Tax=Shinella sp. S4-D37 TaxID=3161999 RepID=UPI0034659DFE
MGSLAQPALQREFAMLEEADWDRGISVTLTTAFLSTRLYLPDMLADGYGRIVNEGELCQRRRAGGRRRQHPPGTKSLRPIDIQPMPARGFRFRRAAILTIVTAPQRAPQAPRPEGFP